MNLYNFVFHCDIRDTFFQIFLNYEPYLNRKSFLGVNIEDALNEKIDKKQIIDYVGEEKYTIIQNERIICEETMWGTIYKFLEFFIAFQEKMKESPRSIEQGLANYILNFLKIAL